MDDEGRAGEDPIMVVALNMRVSYEHFRQKDVCRKKIHLSSSAAHSWSQLPNQHTARKTGLVVTWHALIAVLAMCWKAESHTDSIKYHMDLVKIMSLKFGM